MDEIRTFVSLPLAAQLRASMADLGKQLSENIEPAKVRWTAADQIHLTLRFLGATDPGRVDEISSSLDAVASGFRSFELNLGELGCFPNFRRPDVIWLGLEDPDGDLGNLKKHLDASLRELGWPREARVFVPHLTLGRVREKRLLRGNVIKKITNRIVATVPVESLDLMQSILKRGVAEYHLLHRANLTSD